MPRGQIPTKAKASHSRKAPTNELNDLSAKDWLISTRSVWCASDYDMDQTLPVQIRHFKKLILFFTKQTDLVLNPLNEPGIQEIGSAMERRVVVQSSESVDFILLQESNQFPNWSAYKQAFTITLKDKYTQFHQKLKKDKYLCIIVKNFYFKNSEFISFHHDLSLLLEYLGFKLKGLTIWIPQADLKLNDTSAEQSLIHENILIFRKENPGNSVFALNLSDKQILISQTLYYPSYMLSIPPPRDKFKAQHPATFPEPDIKNLITFFTELQQKPKILDPFSGVGSTLLACQELNLEGWGIELTQKWIDLTKKRFHHLGYPLKIDGEVHYPDQTTIERFLGQKSVGLESNAAVIQNLLPGDAFDKIQSFEPSLFDFIVTSPPYWGILTKKIDHKTKHERVEKGLPVKYTIVGQDATFLKDLGNIESYNEFLNQLIQIFQGCYRVLKDHRYMAVIISDFRDRAQFYLYHCDIAKILRRIGFKLTSITILHQGNKKLYPYGYPFVFVSNIHHQNIIIVKKEVDKEANGY